MKSVKHLTPTEGIELGLTILLEQGFSSPYWPDWETYAKAEYGDEDISEYSISSLSEAWQALLSYVPKGRNIEGGEGISANFVADEADGPYASSSTYYVIISLSDNETTRYFKRDGWYASYDGGHLDDGDDSEVFPYEKTVKMWGNV
jgi:hypothetical protein